MAKQVIDLTSTTLVMGGLTWAWCKRISDGVAVSTTGSTLEERGSGIYIINNPNVTEDSDFRVYVTADSTKYAVGVFSPADGDIAQKITVNNGVEKIHNAIEFQRGHHTGQGMTFHLDLLNGNDVNDGLTKATAKLTWAGVNALVVAYRHDIIWVYRAGVVNTRFTLDKAYTFVRCVGRDTTLQPNDATGPTVSVTAPGCELSGIILKTHTSGNQPALKCTADFLYLYKVHVDGSRGYGMEFENTSHNYIFDSIIQDAGSGGSAGGILFKSTSGQSIRNFISKSRIIRNVQGSGVVYQGANTTDNYILDNGTVIAHNGGYGVNEIDSADYNHIVGPGIMIEGNTLGDINLTGINSSALNANALAFGNLEDMFDGTGYFNNVAPSYQGQIAVLAGGISQQINIADMVIIYGTQTSGFVSDLTTDNDQRLVITANGSGLLEFILRAHPLVVNTDPVELHLHGFYDEAVGATNSAQVRVYDFVHNIWTSVRTLTNANADQLFDEPLNIAFKAPTAGTLEGMVYAESDVLIKFIQITPEIGSTINLDHVTVGYVGAPVTLAQIEASTVLAKEATLQDATNGLAAIKNQTVLIYNSINAVGGVQSSIQMTLTDIEANIGSPVLMVDVLIRNAVGDLFDPADITDPLQIPGYPATAPRKYNGAGGVFYDSVGNRVQIYQDISALIPLTDQGLCHHTAQTNKPQIFPRIGNGAYRFYIKKAVFYTNGILNTEKLNVYVGMWDTALPTYGGAPYYLIQDPDPNNSIHFRAIFSVNVSEAIKAINVLSATSGSVVVSAVKAGGTFQFVRGNEINYPYGPLGKDVTGRKIYFAVKKKEEDPDYVIGFTNITASVTDPLTFTGLIPFTAGLTKNLAKGKYYLAINSYSALDTLFEKPLTEAVFVLDLVDRVINNP